MSLYPKKLKNTEDLQREQEQLEKQLKKLKENSGQVFSVGGILGNVASSVGQAVGGGEKKKDTEKGKEAPAESNGVIPMLLEYLPMAMPFIEMGFSAIKQRMSAPSKKKERKAAKESPASQQTTDKKKGNGKSIVRAVAFELISGYLKWKAIELTYKGAKYLVEQRREKRAMRELEEEMG